MKKDKHILVTVQKSWTGKYYTLTTIGMAFKDALIFGSNVPHDQANGRKELIKNGMKLNDILHTSVSLTHYDHESGKSIFVADTIQDVKNWETMYKAILKINYKS